jgi:hypothetical protein
VALRSPASRRGCLSRRRIYFDSILDSRLRFCQAFARLCTKYYLVMSTEERLLFKPPKPERPDDLFYLLSQKYSANTFMSSSGCTVQPHRNML